METEVEFSHATLPENGRGITQQENGFQTLWNHLLTTKLGLYRREKQTALLFKPLLCCLFFLLLSNQSYPDQYEDEEEAVQDGGIGDPELTSSHRQWVP